MAEAAQAQASAAISPTDIKREPSHHDGLDFTMPTDLAAKRPLENVEATIETPDAKRLKAEANAPEENYDDEMSLLVQNALSNINDIIGQFSEEPENQGVVPTTEPGVGGGGAFAQDTELSQLPELPPVTFASDPTSFVRKANVNALASTAITMLLIIAHKPFDEVAEKMREPDSQHACKFQQLRGSLEALRKIYSDKSIMTADDFDLDLPNGAAVLQFVNLAQLASWLLDGTSESVREAESHLLMAFRDEIIGLPKRIVDLLIGLKTHRAAQAQGAKGDEKLSDEELDSIFLAGTEDQLRIHNVANQIIGSDATIIDSLNSRMAEVRGLAPETSIPEKYPLDDLIRTFGPYVHHQLATATDLGEKLGIEMPAKELSVEPATADVEMDGMDLDDLTSFFEKTATGLVESALAGLEDEQVQSTPVQNTEPPTIAEPVNGTSKPDETTKTNGFITDYKELEALVAESTSNYVKTTLQGLSPTPYQPTVPTSTTESMAAQSNYMSHLQHHPQNTYYSSFPHATTEHEQHLAVPGQNLPPNQSCSSAMLYEKARQAALSRQTAHTRREGLHSTRRPWSQEEEKALMTGLDMVKGPHWSQILTLFGPNGTVSDILKDRTQVQLKDKARNLKLFFLKTNSEMPYYLNTVTGELKTRAPTQAARKEAEERARLNSEEDQAKLQGIMALTGGLQQQAQQNRAAGGSGPGIGTGVVTPAQAAAQAAAASGQDRTVGGSASTATATSTTTTGVPQARPQTQVPGQQTTQTPAQTATQSFSKPQSQLPPQLPRPQPQQPIQPQGQTNATAGAQHNGQQTAAQQPQQSAQQQQQASTPGQPQAQAATDTTSSTTASAVTTAHQSPATGPTGSPAQTQQTQQPAHQAETAVKTTSSLAMPSLPAQAQDQAPQPEKSATPDALPELDMDTEAALIRDLQAAVAQATTS